VKNNLLHKTGVLGAILLLLSLLTIQWNVKPVTAQSTGEFDGAIFDVIPDPTTTVVTPGSALSSTFYLQGKMYRFRAVNQATCSLINPDEPVLGTWHAWGEVATNGRLVIHHTFNLTALNGAFEVQGITGITLANGMATATGALGSPSTGPTEALAIAGGSGTYKSISGQADIRPYCGPANLVNSPDPAPPFKYDRAFCVGIEKSRRNSFPDFR